MEEDKDKIIFWMLIFWILLSLIFGLLSILITIKLQNTLNDVNQSLRECELFCKNITSSLDNSYTTSCRIGCVEMGTAMLEMVSARLNDGSSD